MRTWQTILYPLRTKICPQIAVNGTNSEHSVLRAPPESPAIWKRSGHGKLLGRHDLQIVLDKILPIWNLASLWWNKAVLTTTHLLAPISSSLIFSSNCLLLWNPTLCQSHLFNSYFYFVFVGDLTFTGVSASSWVTGSRERMCEWETIDCTARTATPTTRVNFYFFLL